jgi:DNA polymerase-3 subunit alpha
MVRIAKENSMPAMAITDHGNMYGAIEFYKECKKVGIKPIIGCEVYVAERKLTDKEPGIDNKRYHLILLAKNLKGYKNLMRIVSEANLKGYYYKPRVDMDLLREFSEGIIALSGCMGGKLSRAVLNGDMDKARELIREHQDVFGKENYFIEIQSHPKIEKDAELREKLIALAKEFDIKVVATQDSHYPCRDDHKAHHTLLQVNTGTVFLSKVNSATIKAIGSRRNVLALCLFFIESGMYDLQRKQAHDDERSDKHDDCDDYAYSLAMYFSVQHSMQLPFVALQMILQVAQ